MALADSRTRANHRFRFQFGIVEVETTVYGATNGFSLQIEVPFPSVLTTGGTTLRRVLLIINQNQNYNYIFEILKPGSRILGV